MWCAVQLRSRAAAERRRRGLSNSRSDSPARVGPGNAPISSAKSGAVMITAITTHRQPRETGRPSGNSRSASGRTSPIAQRPGPTEDRDHESLHGNGCGGLDAAQRQAVLRALRSPAPRRRPRTTSQSDCAVDATPRWHRRCRKHIPIAELVTTKASRASCHDQPRTTHRTAAAMTSSNTKTPRAAADTRIPRPERSRTVS